MQRFSHKWNSENMYDIKWNRERYVGEGYKKITLQSARNLAFPRKDEVKPGSYRE